LVFELDRDLLGSPPARCPQKKCAPLPEGILRVPGVIAAVQYDGAMGRRSRLTGAPAATK
jgi:hypothetical protein